MAPVLSSQGRAYTPLTTQQTSRGGAGNGLALVSRRNPAVPQSRQGVAHPPGGHKSASWSEASALRRSLGA
jgi:hypothetical protein